MTATYNVTRTKTSIDLLFWRVREKMLSNFRYCVSDRYTKIILWKLQYSVSDRPILHQRGNIRVTYRDLLYKSKTYDLKTHIFKLIFRLKKSFVNLRTFSHYFSEDEVTAVEVLANLYS